MPNKEQCLTFSLSHCVLSIGLQNASRKPYIPKGGANCNSKNFTDHLAKRPMRYHKPQHIQHFQTYHHGDSEQVGPTGNANCAAGCLSDKSDGFLQNTNIKQKFISNDMLPHIFKAIKHMSAQPKCP